MSAGIDAGGQEAGRVASRRGITVASLAAIIRPVTVAFLAVPVLVFAIGWLRPAIAAAAVVALLLAAAPLARGREGAEDGAAPDGARVPLPALLLGLAPAVALVLASGAGGLEPRGWDWLKHDAILMDLILQPWPVRYATEAGTTGLVYYVAFYLPAALAGAVAGWTAANLTLLATSVTGAVLAVLWLVVLARGAPILCGLAFTLFSGMDALGVVMLKGAGAIAEIVSDYHLENWAEHWQYSSTPSLVNFVPNQAIAGWLVVALLVDAVRRSRLDCPFLALPAVALLWSPFVALGLAPLAVAAFFRPRRLSVALRAQATVANVTAVFFGALLVTYFAARMGPLALPERYHRAGTAASAGAFWFVPSRVPLADFFVPYVLFVLCEFGALWLLAFPRRNDRGDAVPMRRLMVPAAVTLLVLPLFHYGIYNDLVMRASIPALFLLLVAALQELRRRRRPLRAVLLAAVLAIGAVYPANLVRWHLGAAIRNRRSIAMRPLGAVGSLFHLQLHDPVAKHLEFVTQYLGSTDAAFFRYLARPSSPVDVTLPEPQGQAQR